MSFSRRQFLGRFGLTAAGLYLAPQAVIELLEPRKIMVAVGDVPWQNTYDALLAETLKRYAPIFRERIFQSTPVLNYIKGVAA